MSTVATAPRASDLEAQVHVDRDGFTLDATLQVPAGGVLAVLGPNGAGKTTLLRALAGLVPLSAGSVRLGPDVLEDTTAGVRLPVESRPVGVVFQDHLLFPTMSVRDNVAFGLRTAGVDRRTARDRATRWLAGVGLDDRAAVRPGRLSGGQAQRVALVRALARGPRLLLLDEPLSALDAATRMHVRSELRGHLDTFAGATVLVTHDALDALVLADRLLVVEGGRVVQAGTPAEVARRPRTDYAATVVGLNLLTGRAAGSRVTLAAGGTLVSGQVHAGEVLVAVRPSAVALHRREHEPHGSPRNVWLGQVTGMEARGDGVRVAVSGPPDVLVDVTAAAVADLRLGVGTPVWCAVKASDLDVYPASPAT